SRRSSNPGLPYICSCSPRWGSCRSLSLHPSQTRRHPLLDFFEFSLSHFLLHLRGPANVFRRHLHSIHCLCLLCMLLRRVSGVTVNVLCRNRRSCSPIVLL